MGITKTLGGDRLGSGKKMKVELHNYERSTHDLGYIWRNTMSVGTLVPFLCEVALPGDTFDIALDCDVKTHPTVGPLFGSMKVQLDIFKAAIRLYQGDLHQNKIGIGMKMSDVKLPLMRLWAQPLDKGDYPVGTDMDNVQINPSNVLSYLGLRGIGWVDITEETTPTPRDFNAVPLLMYLDTYKNYYANKQETITAGGTRGFQIFTPTVAFDNTSVDGISLDGANLNGTPIPITTPGVIVKLISNAGKTLPNNAYIIIQTDKGDMSLDYFATQTGETVVAGVTTRTYTQRYYITGNITPKNWRYITPTEIPNQGIQVKEFLLHTIDDMKSEILAAATNPGTPFLLNSFFAVDDPYYNILWAGNTGSEPTYQNNQQGLCLKTYQNDLFNNWLDTELIDGNTGINEITKVDTTGNAFTIDELQLSKKVYDMLNRVVVAGGTYQDWIHAIYDHTTTFDAETPIYEGGLIKELVFQEVVSNVESPAQNGTIQPLGTLAGRGTMASKHKGGRVHIKVDEHSYIMGIVSITPRVDYSQGNKWDTALLTMDDFHKPGLDGIGFQELVTEQLTWWDTNWNHTAAKWETKSAGKQPAWMNYMTNVNQVRGNFAFRDNEMFMTLNRRYEWNAAGIGDLTTYIDPEKFNFIFAATSLDSQNYWTQIAVDMEVRRKMSAKIMPHL